MGDRPDTSTEERASVPDEHMAFFIREYYEPMREEVDGAAVGKGEGHVHCQRLAVARALEQWRKEHQDD